jgi:hypothetical protein
MSILSFEVALASIWALLLPYFPDFHALLAKAALA